MQVYLPGDNVPEMNDSKINNSNFLLKQGYVTSTKVLGKQTETGFEAIKPAIVPQLNDIVIARVIRAKRKEAHLIILMANDIPLHSPLLAELRSIDIAEKDVDNQIASHFCHPGDLVKAKVVALGRSGFYAQLSTAYPGLGVVHLTRNE